MTDDAGRDVDGSPEVQPGEAGGDGPGARLRLRDEILQMMYWMKGEGLVEDPGPVDLQGFLAGRAERSELERELEAMAETGLLERAGEGRYRLTGDGAMEGGRRFSDAFDGLTGQAHGECNDPTCDCRTDPQAALECAAERHGAAHGH